MNKGIRPAVAIPPGCIVSRELEARGWTQRDLAAIMGRPATAINEIINSVKQITPQTALELAQAFGTSPEFWMNLETNYRLCLAQRSDGEKTIARKSRVYGLVPVRELLKRGWIRAGETIEELEDEVCRFLEIASVDVAARMAVSFRVSRERGPETNAQIAWLKRVQQLARAQHVAAFSRARLGDALSRLIAHAEKAAGVSEIPSVLMGLGVRFIVVPPLPRTFVDGAVFHLGSDPVIALSLRYDRIDAFWFTLMHEVAHLLAGHKGAHLDNDIYRAAETDEETRADDTASQWLIDQKALDAFIKTTRPYFSRTAIELFARQQGRHPGIVLGQLHHRKVVGYSHLRGLLVKASPYLRD